MGDIIRKKKNGKVLGWYIRWVDLDGKRKQRASHQPTFALAKRLLLEIEARVARGQAGLIEPGATGAAVAVAAVRAVAGRVWRSESERSVALPGGG